MSEAGVSERKMIVRIDVDLLDAVKAKAKAEDLTLSQVVRRLLRVYLKDDLPDLAPEDEE